MSRGNGDAVDLRSPALVRLFGVIMAREMRRSFAGVRVARPGIPELPAHRPVLVFTNHPSWWDPAFFIVLATRCFAGRIGYGPIDAAQLDRYPLFDRLGLFGLEAGTVSGARRFFETGGRVLSNPSAMLWVTAQGAFTDPRARPLCLRPGIAHLLRHRPQAAAVPLAVEYPFWSERCPEALCRFGPIITAHSVAASPAERITARLADELQRVMEQLADDARSRDPARFVPLLAGRRGINGVYDFLRRLRAYRRGRDFDPGHGLAE